MSKPSTADDRKLPIFIDSKLDDAGLTPAQFRVYARIARRAGKGLCFEAISSIANGCKIDRKTVMAALRFLLETNLIKRESRAGVASNYTVTDKSDWQLPGPNDTPTTRPKRHPRPNNTPAQLTPRPGGPIDTPLSISHEGTPIEGTPNIAADAVSDATLASTQNNSTVKANPPSECRAAVASKKQRPNGKTPDPRATHPAIVAVRGFMSRFPDKAIWDEIIEKVGDVPNMERMTECVKAWARKSTNMGNLDVWLFDWYFNGIPATKNGNGSVAGYVPFTGGYR